MGLKKDDMLKTFTDSTNMSVSVKYSNISNNKDRHVNHCDWVSMISVSASHMVVHRLAPRPVHTKDHHKNGTDCLPAYQAMR